MEEAINLINRKYEILEQILNNIYEHNTKANKSLWQEHEQIEAELKPYLGE